MNAALEDRKVRNIALTGRYGVGKSSVLEEFARQEKMRKRVLFLSLSTLGPAEEGESGTNQIEKELVKQLLHREKPSRLPQSRYQRIEGLARWRAAAEATALLAAVGVALWLFGVFPSIPGLSGDHRWWVRVGAGVAASAAAVGVLAWVRLAVHNRLVVSEVSAGGASISLAGKAESYFDKFLDEVVYFFGSVRRVDIVIFEDLDRFGDPGIFEALRELNTLLNNSKQMGGKTIRFVYALRDSIFEKLGRDTKNEENDAARAEAVRANRTKFFDLVIPIVPFITHRTSRDLLTQTLSDDKLTPVVPVGDEIVDLTARHLPDMRLLTNIRNEYSVFAKRLITDRRGVESLEADKLFAMVVYKNIHLTDFEHVLLGRSNLDTVYRLSRELVTESINVRRARLRRIADAIALHDTLTERAEGWGEQLAWYFEKMRVARNTMLPLTSYIIGSTEFEPSQVGTDEFWRELVTDGNRVTARFVNPSYQPVTLNVTMNDVQRLLGDSLPIDDWDSAERAELAREQARLRADLDVLRTADLEDLAKRADFTLTRDDDCISFKVLLERHIDSEIGRALITEGFIDRYYTLYVAQYYGDRVPPNAMNFIVQHVDTNRPDNNYPFNDEEEIAAVLRETNRSFLSEVSAYNISILDYLLERADSGAHTVLDALIRHIGEPEQAFLEAHLAEGARAATAVAYLAGRWQAVFTQLVEKVDLAHDKRVELVDVALANSNSKVDYELNDAVRDFLQGNYKSLPTLAKGRTKLIDGSDVEAEPGAATGPGTVADRGVDTDAGVPTNGQVRNAVNTMTRAGFVCDDLAALKPVAMRLVVESDCYALTAQNLRTALGDPATLSLDRVRKIDTDVYNDVLENPDEYLRAIANDIASDAEGKVDTENDAVSGIGIEAGTRSGTTSGGRSRTRWSVEDPAAFTDVVTDLEHHSKQQAANVISRANPNCIVNDLATVPTTTWEALAQCQRFQATLANVDVHIRHLGELDADLAAILTAAGSVSVPARDERSTSDDSANDDHVSETKVRVAETILKASKMIPDPTMRVRLVSSLGLEDWFPVAAVQPETGPLLGLLIGERVCADEPALFEHFDTSDWETLRCAIDQSTKFTEFVTPELLDVNMTSQLLESKEVKVDVRRAVLHRFDEFVAADNRAALSAAGHAALATNTRLDAVHITSIASGTGDADLVVRLLHQFGHGINVDETIDALWPLDAPYDELANSGAKLTFPRTDHHKAVLKRLQDDGRITARAYPKSLKKAARIEVSVN